MAKRFRRSRTNQQVAGVCAGLAEYTGMSVDNVRIATVLLAVFTSAPVVIAYLMAAFFVPVAEDGEGEPELNIDWRADGVRMSWKGPTVPFSHSWAMWLGVSAALISTALFLTGVFAYVVAALGEPSSGSQAVGVLASLAWPVGLLLIGAARLPRTYALTLTQSALWVDRPLQSNKRVDPAMIESINTDANGLHVLLRDGEVLMLPAPPQDQLLDDLLAEVDGTRRRVLAHQNDLEAASEERRHLQRLMAARAPESP